MVYLYKLNRIGDKLHPRLTLLQIFTLPWSSCPLNPLIPVEFADKSSFLLVNISFLGSALIWSTLHGQVPSASQ